MVSLCVQVIAECLSRGAWPAPFRKSLPESDLPAMPRCMGLYARSQAAQAQTVAQHASPHSFRETIVRAQLGLLGPRGGQQLGDRAASLHAVRDAIAQDPVLSKKVDLRAFDGQDPGYIAAAMSRLYDKKLEARASAVLPMEHVQRLVGESRYQLQSPQYTQLNLWRRDLEQARAENVPGLSLYEAGPFAYRWRTWLRFAQAVSSTLAVQPVFMKPGVKKKFAMALASPAHFLSGVLGSLGKKHWHRAEKEFVMRALEGRVDTRHRDHLLAQMHGKADYVAMPGLASDAHQVSVADLIRQSRGRAIAPTHSWGAAASGLANFFSQASMLAYGLQQSPHAWDALTASMSLSIMQAFDWQPLVLGEEYLHQAEQLRAQGYRILISAGHASDLDTLTLIAATHSLKPRPVAKRELLRAGGFGSVAWFNPWRPALWPKAGCLPTSLLVDRLSDPKARQRLVHDAMNIIRTIEGVHAGGSVAFFVPGTRLGVPALGLGGFKSGIVDVALAAIREGYKIAILPLIAEGQQNIFSSDYKAVAKRGVRQGSGVVLQYGKPYTLGDLQEPLRERFGNRVATLSDKERSSALADLMWERHARLSLPVQWFLHQHQL